MEMIVFAWPFPSRVMLGIILFSCSLGLAETFQVGVPSSGDPAVIHGSRREGRSGAKFRVTSATVASIIADDDADFGCGLLGHIPGIDAAGKTEPATQHLIDGLKESSTFNKVSYFNWNYAPDIKRSKPQYLSREFLFLPEMWGVEIDDQNALKQSGQQPIVYSDGAVSSPAMMGGILLGTNEPDMYGSCNGNMLGKCVAPCADDVKREGKCPIARPGGTPGLPYYECPKCKGQCDCSLSSATSAGFWSVPGCFAAQPLPELWKDPECTSTVMQLWRKSAALAVDKGYKHLSAPLVAGDLEYAKKFIQNACECTGRECACTDASCGCPTYLGFHHYVYDCQPEQPSGYAQFEQKLAAAAVIMDMYPFVKGAIINEVGILNCASDDEHPNCVPDSGSNPASGLPDHACPNTGDIIKGLVSRAAAAKTADGRKVAKAIFWYQEDRKGGSYNLQLFNSNGSLNEAGAAYIDACRSWRNASRGDNPVSVPVQPMSSSEQP